MAKKKATKAAKKTTKKRAGSAPATEPEKKVPQQQGFGYSDAESIPDDLKDAVQAYREAQKEKSASDKEWKRTKLAVIELMDQHDLKTVPTLDGKKIVRTVTDGIAVKAIQGDEDEE